MVCEQIIDDNVENRTTDLHFSIAYQTIFPTRGIDVESVTPLANWQFDVGQFVWEQGCQI